MGYEISNDRVKIVITNTAEDSIHVELVDKESCFCWSDNKWEMFLSVMYGGIKYTSTSYKIIDGSIESASNQKHMQIRLSPVFENEACQDLNIIYTIKLPEEGNWFEENIRIINHEDNPVILENFSLQWQKSYLSCKMKYFAVPFLAHDLKPQSVLMDESREFEAISEGVELICEDYGLIIARKPSDNEPIRFGTKCKNDGIAAFGGINRGVPGDITGITINTGELIDYGDNRYMFFKGEIEEGLLLYRNFMRENGVKMPQNYDPPINYCIFYECGDYYQHKAMLEEFDFAEELGCTMLYLDQGWEDYSGSGIWDEVRLDKLEKLVEKAHSKGMEIGVLVKMHARAYNWPYEIVKKDPNGNILHGDIWGPGHQIGICPSSSDWRNIKTERLVQIAKAGVRFFSFDFNDYQPETACCDKSHPHNIPMREWEHVRFVAEQQAMVKKACPDVLIEAHDWKSAGEYIYPIYMFNSGHHERWGFEYMWKPFDDFKSGRLHNLYYYNMAYEKPLYLHMDLASDNENAVVFWYIASTVRHFGVGNYRNLDENKKNLYKCVMKVYKEYKQYFSEGVFNGAGPCVHYHTLEGKGTIALFFNDSSEERKFNLDLFCERSGKYYFGNNVKSLFGNDGTMMVIEGKTIFELQLGGYSVSVMFFHE